MADILVFVDHADGKPRKASCEALGEAKRRAADAGGAVDAVVLGPGCSAWAAGLGQYGVRNVYVADDAAFAAYSADGFALAVSKAARTAASACVLLSATARGRDLSARVAARLEAACAADCTAMSFADGAFTFVRPVYAGKAYTTVRCTTPITVATLRPNVFPVDASGSGSATVMPLEAGVTAGDLKAVVKAFHASEGGDVDVAEAPVVVSGGRGLKGPEHFALLKDLAHALGGAVGASRAVVDAGWIDHSHQVGQTGKTVSPGLYVAVGISGAVQHLAGMSSSKVIVAINKDPEAPIFKIADYGIVGDLFEVVPALTAEVRKLRA